MSESNNDQAGTLGPGEQCDMLLRIAAEQMEVARHHESLRERSTQIILLIAGGLIAVLKIPSAAIETQIIISLALIVLGSFGALLSWKHYEKHQEHYEQATAIYQYCFNNWLDKPAWKAAKIARDKVRHKFGYFSKVRLNKLWLFINILVVFSGVYFLTSFLARMSMNN